MPYTPRTNGKAERFIQTSLRERAYARAYLTPNSVPWSCPSSCTAIIGTDLMPVLAKCRPSPDSG
jgi:hypothetical protein